MEKEIIGYRIIKPEYEKTAVQICKSKGARDTEDFHITNSGTSFGNTSFCKIWLEDAGVLDLWFEPVYKPTELVKSWEDAYKPDGYIISSESSIVKVDWGRPYYDNKRIFKTSTQAKSALAFAQLSHIVADANGDWVAYWSNDSQEKYVIEALRDKLIINSHFITVKLLPTKSEEIADACLEKHRTLWEDFWMISK